MGRRKLRLCHIVEENVPPSQENRVNPKSSMNVQSDSLPQSNPSEPQDSSVAVNYSRLGVEEEDRGSGADNNSTQDRMEMEEDGQNHPSPIAGNARSRKRRGPTQLNDIWNLPVQARVVIGVNAAYQPSSTESGRLSRFLSTMLKKPNTIPLDKWSWHVVPDKYKEACWRVVQSKFHFESDPPADIERIKKFVLRKLGSLWRNYKCELKDKHFDITKPSSEIKANAPQTVHLGQFGRLVDFWFSDEGKKRSNTNKANREKQTEVYTAGSKAISQYANEWSINHTSSATRVNMYPVIRTKKDGSYVSTIVEENIGKMTELQALHPESTSGEQSGCSFWSPDDVYSQVLGPERHGRVRGVGFGPTPSTFGYGKARGSNIQNMTSQNEAAKDKKIQDLEERMQAMEKVQAMMITKESASHAPVNGRSAADLDSPLESQPMFVVDLN